MNSSNPLICLGRSHERYGTADPGRTLPRFRGTA